MDDVLPAWMIEELERERLEKEKQRENRLHIELPVYKDDMSDYPEDNSEPIVIPLV